MFNSRVKLTRGIFFPAVVFLIVFPLSGAFGKRQPIWIDGFLSDWGVIKPLAVDVRGDAGDSGVDFDTLWVTDQRGLLFIRFRTNIEIGLQGGNQLSLLIDCDNDPSTGEEVHGMGVDFSWDFGARQGISTAPDGGTEVLGHADISLIAAPSTTADDFELAIDLGTVVEGGRSLFPSRKLRLKLVDRSQGGDVIPSNRPALYKIRGKRGPRVKVFGTERLDPSHLRFVTWNVLNDGIVKRTEYFSRVLNAINPDIIALVEVWESRPEEVVALLNSWLPIQGGGSWHAAKHSADVILASRWPITGSWPVEHARASAFLARLPEPFSTGLYVIVAHAPCCGKNDKRQLEIDAVMATLRDAMRRDGEPPLPANIPVVITGDMNLVGDRRQLETLIEGRIVNRDVFGEPFAPDWDGSPLVDLVSRQPARMMSYTWRDPESSYPPGRLDFVFYTDSRLGVGNHFILDALELPAKMLRSLGLEATDTGTASDHLPLVFDFHPLVK